MLKPQQGLYHCSLKTTARPTEENFNISVICFAFNWSSEK